VPVLDGGDSRLSRGRGNDHTTRLPRASRLVRIADSVLADHRIRLSRVALISAISAWGSSALRAVA